MLGGAGIPALAQSAFDCAAVSQIPRVECEALVALYLATDGSNWSEQTHWLGTDTPCHWHGVRCEQGHIEQLDLKDNRLTGSLPGALGQLTGLRRFDVSYNISLLGILPLELSGLANLETFYFHFTLLCIPAEVAFFDWLKQIGRTNDTNRYCHAIDCSEVNNLVEAECEALKTFFDKSYGITWDNATSWMTTLSPCAWEGVTCRASHVIRLDLRDNSIVGSIPAAFGELIHLEVLRLDNNRLTGSIPPELGNLVSLKDLSLNRNLLRGSLPPEIGKLISLKELLLSHNEIGGTILPEISNLISLKRLALNNNRLSGTIPPEIGNLVFLKRLVLSNNRLSGTLPPEIGRLDSLESLVVYENLLSGTLPLALTQLKHLQVFLFHRTDLCAPSGSTFQSWLEQVPTVIGTNFVCTSTAAEAPAEIPTDYALAQNYPNPFHPTTTIAFDLPRAGPVTLTIYTVQGREVTRLRDGVLPAGHHRATWDAAEVPNGVYLYRLRVPGFTAVRRMIVMR